jgi:inorganic triphosphatase YgiF
VVSLDYGEVVCDEVVCEERKQHLVEAEFELKRGSLALLFELAREAIGRFDAPLSFVGKGLRGRRLQLGISKSPECRIKLLLHAKMTCDSAFQQFVAAGLQQSVGQ